MTGTESHTPRQQDISRTAESRLAVLRKQAANEPGRLAVTEEQLIRRLASAGQGGSY